MDQGLIWDYFQNEQKSAFKGAHSRINALVARVTKLIKLRQDGKSPHAKVLHIGVGDGYCENVLMKNGIISTSMDPSSAAIRNLKEKGFDAVIGSVDLLPFGDDSFDYVICSEVLEHLDAEVLKKGMQEIYRCLKKGGVFLGTVPFNECLVDNLTVCPSCNSKFHRWGHEQSFDKENLQQLFTSVGLKVDFIRIQAFPNWGRKGFLNFLKSLTLYVLGIMGQQIVSPKLYFQGIK